VAGATLAVVLGVGFAVQAAALGRPGAKPMLVVRVVAQLVNYHDSRATMTVGRSRLSAVCRQTWIHHQREVTIGFGDGRTLIDNGTTLVPTGQLEIDEFELAGCPRPLTEWLASQINRGAPLDVNATRVFGKRVYRLRFPTARPELELYVSRRGALPVALRIASGAIRGMSELRYGFGSRELALRFSEEARSMRAW